eukprot:gene8769-biopygen9196
MLRRRRCQEDKFYRCANSPPLGNDAVDGTHGGELRFPAMFRPIPVFVVIWPSRTGCLQARIPFSDVPPDTRLPAIWPPRAGSERKVRFPVISRPIQAFASPSTGAPRAGCLWTYYDAF